ncbi:hypothetical protein, partial [Ellagibacter isourolithinifaciens]|uniref:hypothetical protein n=1 Tax=Ellagibacter isourolithinifaciens TaxID=2137581 RepID=UPI003A90E2FD
PGAAPARARPAGRNRGPNRNEIRRFCRTNRKRCVYLCTLRWPLQPTLDKSFPWLLDSTAKLLDLMKSADFLAVTPFSKCTAITHFSKQGEIGLFCSLKWTSAKL